MKFYLIILSFFFFQCSRNDQHRSNQVQTSNSPEAGRSIASVKESSRGISSVNEGRPGIKLCNTSSVDVVGREYIASLKMHLEQWVDNVGEPFEGLIEKIDNCSSENDYWVRSNHKEFKPLTSGCHRYICMELLDLTKGQIQGQSTSNALKHRAKLEINLDNK